VRIVCSLLLIYQLAVVARIILEYIPVSSDHPLARVRSGLRAVTEPVLAPLRRIIPTVRMGSVGLDLSPLVLLVGINLIAAAIC
jgi:YggT family protein